MKWRGAIVIVEDPAGHVLLLRRGPTDRWRPGHWNLPGGKIDPGETPRAAATRELWEEANIVPWDPLEFLGRLKGSGTYVFRARLRMRQAVKSNDGEHDAFEWARWDSLPSPCVPSVRKLQRGLPR